VIGTVIVRAGSWAAKHAVKLLAMKQHIHAGLQEVTAAKTSQETLLCDRVLGVISLPAFERLSFEQRMDVCVNMLALLELMPDEGRLPKALSGRLNSVISEILGCYHLSVDVSIMATSLILHAGQTFSLGVCTHIRSCLEPSSTAPSAK
jgi:ribosome biogenesis SPOUT family RNA methylase Rps3